MGGTMEYNVDVAIVGAGTAGISAFREVEKVTRNLLFIQDGPHGTTCARVGCMPSKTLIQVANDFHRRRLFEHRGIRGADGLSVDGRAVMHFVSELRDRFVRGTLGVLDEIGDRLLTGRAQFEAANVLRVGDHRVRAARVILATGSRPIVPPQWKEVSDRILTTDDIFEWEELPEAVAVVGLGAIGLELGQALARLGVRVVGVDQSKRIGGITDPKVNGRAIAVFSEDFPLWLGEPAELARTGQGVRLSSAGRSTEVPWVLASLGRRPNLDGLGLERLGVEPGPGGKVKVSPTTLRLGDLPIWVAGDANGDRPVLHEAADEGRIAGYNASRADVQCFVRRAPLGITFTEPNLAFVGRRFAELDEREIAIGEVSFDGQGRSLIRGENHGVLRVYAERETGKLLGCEMAAPEGEHLAQFLAPAIQRGLTVFDVLHFPFYHPVTEEALRTALRDLARHLPHPPSPLELALCEAAAVKGLE